MSAWIVGTASYADPASMSGVSGLVAGQYWFGEVQVGTPRYERRTYDFPGVDGVGVKAFGFRERRVAGGVLYIASSPSALRAQIDADRAALANLTFTTVVPDGATLPNCQLDDLPDGPIQTAGGGLWIMRTAVTLAQLRE